MALLPLGDEAVVRLGASLPFGQAAALLAATTGLQVSKATFDRATLAAGRALVAAEEAATAHLGETLPASGAAAVAHQQISIDGAFVPVIGEADKRWAEVKTMAIGTVEQRDGGPKAVDLSYLSRLADHRRFAQAATLETHRRGTEKAQRVTAVADGADWIQDVLALQCPAATVVLDWSHASSYVNSAAQALFADPREAADWRSARLNELMHGDPEDVLVALCKGLQHALGGSELETAICRSLGYLTRRIDQIQYRQFRERGLPIGSGIVESANKFVVEARLKGAGMHWLAANVDPMLALRCTLCSGDRWSATWHVLARYRLRCAAEKARSTHEERHQPPPPPPRQPKRKRRNFRDFSLRGSPRRAKP
jgi:hypothetical protein